MVPKRTIILLLSLPCLVFLLIKGHQSRLEPVDVVVNKNDEDQLPPQPQSQPVDSSVDKPAAGHDNNNQLSSKQQEVTTQISSSSPTSNEKTIFVITPTYTRPTQMADLTRLGQTLEWAAAKYGMTIFWIVSEDSTFMTPQVTSLLSRMSIPSAHLLGSRPITHRDKRSGRGVSNRLRGLQWLRQTFSGSNQEGIIYFADDDNAYDIRVFKEMKDTRLISVWPVGLIAKIGVSSPVINSTTGQIDSFHDPFMRRRKFAVDMAGFAVDLQRFLTRPKATMPYKVGYEEDFFIRSLGVKMSDLEPKGNNCTEVLVWHTKTQPGVFPNSTALTKKFEGTNLPSLYHNILPESPPSTTSSSLPSQ